MVELSVHLITYNNEKHIKETLESILSQKVDFKYEIVVGDDCSTDETLKIINTYKEKHPERFKILKNKSQLGILKNFKSTLDRCSGKYVFDIAGDDLLKGTDALQKMVDTLKADNTLGFVDSGFDLLFEAKNKIEAFNNKHLICVPKDAYKNNILLGKITPIGVCFNKALLDKHVDFEAYINMNTTIEDYPVLVDLVMNTDFKIIPESLHFYRVHHKSYSHQKSFEHNLFLMNQMKNLFEYFSNKYNYTQKVVEIFYEGHYKKLLYFAGYYNEKEYGKMAFKKIKDKKLRDYIHFFASKSRFFRFASVTLKRLFLK